jgi:hypothetical protein
MSYDKLGWYKDTIIRMTWDEILEIMDERIKNGSWKKYVESLGGKPPHVIKHDAIMEKYNKPDPLKGWLP